MERKPTWAHRFEDWLRSRSLIVILFLTALFVSSIVTLVGAGYRVESWLDDQFRWRGHEYEKLAGLHSDFTLARFEEQLGAPVVQRQSSSERWTEYLFRGRDYWVQAISRTGSQSVAFYAVTSCSRDFKPEFRLPNGEAVALHRSNLESPPGQAFGSEYWRGSSSRPSFMKFTGGSHADNFKYFGWGFNGACIDGFPLAGGDGDLLADYDEARRGRGQFTKRLRGVGRSIVVNTFAEWGPTEGNMISGGWPPDISVGIDQILIGAAENESAW